jgi:putative transcriptional regulator
MKNNRHKIIAGLREAISYAKGEPSRGRLTVVNVPENIDVKKLREKLGMSQAEFALRYGFSLGTLRQWEQRRRYPDGAARVLLTVISHQRAAVERALNQEARESQPRRRAAAG